MSRTICIIVALVSLGCASRETLPAYTVIPSEQHAEKESMTYSIEGVFREKHVEASVTLRQFRDSDKHADRFHWYGTDGGSPELVVSKVTLSLDGQDIKIPPHAYGRHGDFSFQGNPLRLLTKDKELILRFGASDGAGAYFLDIIATQEGFLRSRTYTHNPSFGTWE